MRKENKEEEKSEWGGSISDMRGMRVGWGTNRRERVIIK